MNAILWFVILLLIFAVVMFTPLNTIILRYLYKNERIAPSSSTAQNNVTLHNEYNGVKYAPVSIERVGDHEALVRVESLEAPYRETVLNLTREQFKEDPFVTCETGMPAYRIVPRELLNKNFGINDDVVPNPVYTNEELKVMSEEAFKDKTELKGKIAKLEANQEDEINRRIENANDIVLSKTPGK